MFQMCSCFAEFERNIIRERVKSGIARARASGKKLGRRSNISEGTKSAVIELRNSGMSINKVCRTLGIGVASYYSLVKEAA